MNDQILIGILTEIKDLRAEMKSEMGDIRTELKEMKTEMNDRFEKVEKKLEKLEDRVTSLEKSRKEDVRSITDILYSFEQGIVNVITEEIDKRMYM